MGYGQYGMKGNGDEWTMGDMMENGEGYVMRRDGQWEGMG